MKYPIIETCPVCTHQLHVTTLSCSGCGTVIENDFTLSKFAAFTSEQIKFIEIFLMKRGNIKEVEKALGVSYPTVRSKLNDITEKLGEQPQDANDQQRKKDVIARLDNEEISPEQALALLRNEEGS